MGVFQLFIESPQGSGTFIPTKRYYDENTCGYVGYVVAALEQQTGQTFSVALYSGTALAAPTAIAQPAMAHQQAAMGYIAGNISNGAYTLTNNSDTLTDSSGNLLAAI